MSFDNLWVEKYRPKTLEDLCLPSDIRNLIIGWGKDIPHLLFIGNAGVGKTTLAKTLVQNVLKCDYLYINASDENGIDTIRTKVTGFVQTKSLDGNIKVVILDEADGLTLEGQKCLRNLMESFAKTARFILTGNFKHKISDAIRSRCQSLDLKPTLKQAVQRCIHILKTEEITIPREQVDNLVKLIQRNYPDLRACIKEMQKCCVTGVLDIPQKSDNFELCDRIFQDIEDNNTLETRKYLIENDTLFNSDWDALLVDLLNFIYRKDFDEFVKKSMIITIADHLERASRVDDKEINFFACILNLERLEKENPR